MAKKGYPGLVVVPPSDRTILRRRLLHGTLFIVALIWCVSILPLWPPDSERGKLSIWTGRVEELR